MNWIDYLVLAVYFSSMIAIGLWSMLTREGARGLFHGGPRLRQAAADVCRVWLGDWVPTNP
jgi:hypothetical protein